MSNALTTGPFRIPQGIFPGAGSPSLLIINLKNPTKSTKKVRVIVEETEPILVPIFPIGEWCVATGNVPEFVICNEVIEVTADSARQLYVQLISTNVILRVTVKGDVGRDAEEIEVSVNGSDNIGQFHESTMFFRHSDFIQVDD